MEVDQVSSLIHQNFDNANVSVEKNGNHYEITVVSEKFSDMRKVSRQQLIYKVLGEYITKGTIHAVVINAYTPSEWSEMH